MSESKHWPSVSVLIATRDRPRALRACVASVLACDYPRFEVIVIDQSRTPVVLPDDPRLKIVWSGGRVIGKSRALNEAIDHAQHAFLAFTDDDCTVPREWLKQGIGALRDAPEAGLLFGALTAMPHDPAEVFVPTFLPEARLAVKGVASAHIRGGAGANLFARRETMEAIGGFDHLLGPGMIFKACEEFDVYYRVLRAGYAVVRDPDTRVVHWGARAVADGSGFRLLRDYYYGEGVVLGKHSRAGDRAAAWLALRIFSQELNWACRGALFHGRLAGARRTASWGRGFIRGFRRAVDPEKRFFRERAAQEVTQYAGVDRRRHGQPELQHG